VKTNPSLRSRLGFGGLLLLALGLPIAGLFLFGLASGGDPRRAILEVGDQVYPIGELWWVVTPLAILSVVAVVRLAVGRRDWLAPILAAMWLGIAVAVGIRTDQYGFAAMTALLTLLLSSGIRRARQDSIDRTGPADRPL
jgi:hypothetical protein